MTRVPVRRFPAARGREPSVGGTFARTTNKRSKPRQFYSNLDHTPSGPGYSVFERKSLKRGFWGFAIISLGGPDSATIPSAMKTS